MLRGIMMLTVYPKLVSGNGNFRYQLRLAVVARFVRVESFDLFLTLEQQRQQKTYVNSYMMMHVYTW